MKQPTHAPPRVTALAISMIVCCVAIAVAAACGGGGGGDDGPVVLNDAPTATLPAVLPDVQIVGQTNLPVSGATYAVEAGDSLSAIADLFGTTAEDIAAANGITVDTVLFIGQELVIPGIDPSDSIPEATDEPSATEEPLPTDTPIPFEPEDTPVPFGGETYTVQEGDIPNTIADQFGISVEALMEANGITDPTGLQIGQVLVIPPPDDTAP